MMMMIMSNKGSKDEELGRKIIIAAVLKGNFL
jgi:hypothetical protein